MINVLHNTQGYPLWQRSYYEHIIRNENELNLVRAYIINNPAQWSGDEDNPANTSQRRNIDITNT